MTYSCIECVDRPVFPSVPSLARHRHTIHRPLPPARKEPTPMPDKLTCPECKETFKGPQGLATHRSRIHGIRPAKLRQRNRLDPIDAALEPLLKRRNRIDERLHDVTALETERARLDKAIAALEAAR